MNRIFYIFRHGETDWNKEKRIQGHTDTILNENGRQQANDLILKFKNIKLDAIYSSDLIRAQETAKALTEKYQIPLFLNRDLREMSYGDAEGMQISELKEKFGEDLWNKIHSFNSANNHVCFPNGETRHQARVRIRSVIERIIEETSFKTIGISTHGGALRNLLHGFLPDGYAVLPIPNCIVYKFEYINSDQSFAVSTEGF